MNTNDQIFFYKYGASFFFLILSILMKINPFILLEEKKHLKTQSVIVYRVLMRIIHSYVKYFLLGEHRKKKSINSSGVCDTFHHSS